MRLAGWRILLASIICLWLPAYGQDYPSKPMRFVVPYSAGSPPDIVARLLGAEMSRSLGQPIVVENKPGADTVIGYEHVARQAPADGYTIAIVPISNSAILPLIHKDLHFDPVNDLLPFVSLVEGRLVFGVSAATPWKSFDEVVAAVRANPNKWNYGAPSVLLRFPMLVLIQRLGLELTYVPYPQAASNYTALMVNDVQMGFLSEASAVATLKDKFRVVAVTGDRSSRSYPQAPTFASLGYPQLPSNVFSFSVRSGTPQPIVDKLRAAAIKALQAPEVRSKLDAMQFEIIDESAEAARQRLADQAKLFAEVARKVGIEPQ
jgi:tripartite-type tricarboxylate transporter receptor subunit TctC